MHHRRPIFPAPGLPPLDGVAPVRRPAATLDLPRLRRLAACLVALALPVTGIAAAETVHRVGTPGTMQAAAPRSPSNGAAAPDGPCRAAGAVREALLLPSTEPRR